MGSITYHTIYYSRIRALGLLVLLFSIFHATAQTTPNVDSSVDTTFIKIGEQIGFTMTIEADTTAQVVFPEGQTFLPLEVVESFPVDTLKKIDRLTLQKLYTLTQFDSGVYVLPRQRVLINDQNFFTDSLRINVATVPVDTLTQNLYDIKPIIEVEKSSFEFWKILVGLGIFLIIGGLVYWFFIRKKELTEEEKEALLPPFDRALLELKKLENSKYLIQSEYKQYYSELTTIVRSYLEEDVHVSALESTTDQLITKMELLKDSGELDLDHDTIAQFKRVLQTADLVKFARSKPPTSTAEQDREAIEQIVVKTHDALPEPTEEELLLNQEYLEEQERKRKKKKVLISIAAAVGALIISFAATSAYYGFGYVVDTIFGHPTKTLLEGEWVNSTYGFPPITMETPEVLIRHTLDIPPEAKAKIKDVQTFAYRNEKGLFTMAVTFTNFTEAVEPDFEKSLEQFLTELEAKGARNITTKQEEFTTLTGVKGLKTFGNGKFKIEESEKLVEGKYTILSFGGQGFQQQVLLSWLEDDPYAEEIVNRILNSIDIKTEI